MQLAGLVLGLQFLIGAVATGICGGLAGPRAALAAMLGVAIAVVPGLYFAVRAMRLNPDASPRDVVRGFYRGEFGKYALTVFGFGLAVVYLPGQFLPLLLTYMACLAAYWVALVIN